MVGIVYAINAERPSEYNLDNQVVIELFDFDSGIMVVNDSPFFGEISCISAENQNTGYYILIDIALNLSGRLKDNAYLKKAGTARIQRLASIYNLAIQNVAYKYKEVRIRGVDYNICLHSNTTDAVENNYKEARIRGVDQA
jgi:hypothetical protein